ncbi:MULTISPECIES: YraN family protein [Proteiniphilum]|uniref:YraN family protein n=2 Tax=Dysgonomonadaceae TaxID=2005520 RepID=UPI001EEBC5C7|nr:MULTISPECIES: YraN family protein [Proteiniphilum]MDD2247598.1 YraN family protein [Proteiniphilum sp.]
MYTRFLGTIKMAEHNELGWKGEDAAVNYLKSKGHRIVKRNWKCHGYEVDIISEEGEYIVFVEVKTRTSTEWGNPEDSIGKHRMRRMIQAAGIYLKMNCIDKPARFDIVAVVWNKQQFELEHIEDAFLPFL